MGFALLHGAQAASATLRAPLALLSRQVPSLNHATPLLSIIKQQNAHTFRPQQCFISPHNDKNILSLIAASRLCFWISKRLSLTTLHVVFISVCPAFLLNFRNIKPTSLYCKATKDIQKHFQWCLYRRIGMSFLNNTDANLVEQQYVQRRPR